MTELLQEFHFLRPLWLLAMAPIIVLLVLLWRSHYQSQQWYKHIAPQLLPALIEGGLNKANRFVFIAIATSWLFACVALAGPVWQKQPSPVVQNTQALVICWDLSPSMLAEDVSPSRLARSRLKIIDLLKSRPDGQTALIAFSGEAYTVTPLTDDIQTIINLLPALAPNTLPTLGSNPEMAFEQANDLLNQAGIPRGDILMITDEIPSDALETLNDFVQSTPHQFTLWGIGTSNGAPIPWGKQGFAKDSSGAIALAKLNEQELRDFAVRTNSFYVPVVNDNSDIEALESLLTDNSNDEDSAKSTDRLFDQWQENGHWLVWACIAMLALGFRRGWLLCAIVVLPSIIITPGAIASPFKTPDQSGFQAYKKQDFDTAAQNFEDKDWQGAANYRSGNYAQAAEAYSQQQGAPSKFNQGNAELLQGNFDKALDAYDAALSLNPNLEPALKNKQLAQALKEQQEKQDKDQQQDGDQNQDEESGEQSESEQDQSDEGEDSDQQKEQQGEQQQDDSQSQNDSGEQNREQGNSSSAMSQTGGDQSSQGSQSSAGAQAGQENSSAGQNSSEQATQAQAQEAQTEPQTEEQQMLENVLRKVPDDPAGLLRAKFEHQFRQRQQELRRGGEFNDTQQAEQRW